MKRSKKTVKTPTATKTAAGAIDPKSLRGWSSLAKAAQAALGPGANSETERDPVAVLLSIRVADNLLSILTALVQAQKDLAAVGQFSDQIGTHATDAITEIDDAIGTVEFAYSAALRQVIRDRVASVVAAAA